MVTAVVTMLGLAIASKQQKNHARRRPPVSINNQHFLIEQAHLHVAIGRQKAMNNDSIPFGGLGDQRRAPWLRVSAAAKANNTLVKLKF